MIISDLNHVEVVSKDQEIVGGGYYYCYYCPSATASAGAGALAIGNSTYASTYTSATAVKGVYSSAGSSSYASAK